MIQRWAVIWRGRNCVVYLKAQSEWSLDPDEAFVFRSWFGARFAAGLRKGAEVVRCWV